MAVVGASATPGSFGDRLVTEVMASPSRSASTWSTRATTSSPDARASDSLDEIDGAVDLVLLGRPRRAVEPSSRVAARRGDRSAVIYGSLFEPDGRPALRARLGGDRP